MGRDQFELAYRRYMEEGGHSYDPWDIAMAWKDYQRDASRFSYLFEEAS